MASIIARLKNEPAVVLGIVFAAVLAALQSLAGHGVIGPDIVATVQNLVGTVQNPGPAVLILAGIITRFFVSPPSK